MKLQKEFYDFMIEKYFHRMYSVSSHLFQLNSSTIPLINEYINSLRPLFRQGDGLDPRLNEGHLLDNLLLPGKFNVEIKPKWGFNCLERRKCKFCRLQPFKPYKIGRYCPTDLFSSNPERIKKALEAIWQTPRNQLRVYHGDCKIEIDRSKQENLFSRVLEILVTDPLLKMIHETQFKLFAIYKKHIDRFVFVDLNDYFDRLDDFKLVQDPLVAFLMSISLEDVSIMVSFDPKMQKKYELKLLDLDIKLPNKIEFYVAEHDLIQNIGGNVVVA